MTMFGLSGLSIVCTPESPIYTLLVMLIRLCSITYWPIIAPQPKPMTKLISDYLLGRVQCVHLKQHKTRSATTKFDVGVPRVHS